MSTLDPGKHPELQLPAISTIKVDGVLAAGLRSFHDRYPFFIVAKEAEVKERRSCVRLRRYGQLRQDSFPGLNEPSVLGADDRLLEPLLDQVRIDVVRGT